MFEITLLGLLISLMLLSAISIVYSTIVAGISPMPSSAKAYIAMLQLIEEAESAGSGDIIDLGSGWGNLVLRLAKKYPQRHVIGYEISLLPWLTSRLLKKFFGLNNLTLYRKDFFKADISDASIIVCYLFPEAMKKLNGKLHTENNTMNFIVSNSFSLPSYKPYKSIQIDDFYQSTIYLYKNS